MRTEKAFVRDPKKFTRVMGNRFIRKATGGKIVRVGRLKPYNKKGKGYWGVMWRTPKGRGYRYESLELHSPHQTHNEFWHWQKNRWSRNEIGWRVGSKHSKRWRIWGKRIYY